MPIGIKKEDYRIECSKRGICGKSRMSEIAAKLVIARDIDEKTQKTSTTRLVARQV